jgi:hypothetical protein
MQRSSLAIIIINADANQEAYKLNRNLWTEPCKGVSIIHMPPEQMRTPGFAWLIDEPAFRSRLCVLVMDP